MNNRNKFFLGIVFIIILVFVFLPEKEQTFLYAAGVDPESESDWYQINNLSIYSKENNDMIEIDLKNNERDKITEFMKSAIVSEKPVKPLAKSTAIAKQEGFTGDGMPMMFTIYIDNKDNYYVSFDHFMYEEEWHKFINDELPEYYLEITKNVPQ